MSRFVWFELMTTDVEGAKAFYGGVVGWKSKRFPGGDYELWLAGEEQVAGLMPLPAEVRKAGAPPHWMGYVFTENVDTTAQRAQSLGGRVLVAPQDIPNVGRFAVLADPQGAAFAVFTPSRGEGSAPDTRGMGHFSWAELYTTDWRAAWKFYSALFGWKATQSMSMGPEMGEYFMFGTDPEQSMGGMFNGATMTKSQPYWLHYANVPSVDEAAKRIPGLGGKVFNGPMDVPGGDRVLQGTDPQGAMFALFSPKPK